MKKRKWLFPFVFVLLTLVLSGCYRRLPVKPIKPITSYYTDSAVEKIDLYVCYRGELGPDADYDIVEELPDEYLNEVIGILDAYQLTRRAFYYDYNLMGHCGIRLYYEDGTIVSYDGQGLALLNEEMETEQRALLELDHNFFLDMAPYFDAISEDGGI